jgi:hypothetical protein
MNIDDQPIHYGVPTTRCDCGGTYKCSHCHRVVGWCMGADDEDERQEGPICDDCVFELPYNAFARSPLGRRLRATEGR